MSETYAESALRPARDIWLGIFVGGLALFLALAVVASLNEALLPEHAARAWLIDHRLWPGPAFFGWVQELGNRTLLGALAVALILALPVKAQGRLWLLLAVLLASWGLEEITEAMVHPSMPGASFPSGHATAASAFYVFGAYLLTDRVDRRLSKGAIWALAIGLVFVSSLTPVVVDVHWSLNTIGGVLLGLSCAAGAAWWSSARRRASATAHDGAAVPLLLYLLYRAYEHRLLGEVKQQAMPRHVAVILDGNRRHGREIGITDPDAVYRLGAKRLDDIVEWCEALGIRELTLWVFSTDNLMRSPEVVASILGAVEAKLSALAVAPETHTRRLRVRAVGRLELLPGDTLAAIRAVEQATSRYDGLTLNIAIAYGGREEIADAVKGLLGELIRRGTPPAELVKGVTEEAIARHLYTAGSADPDLVIRTSGELRLSGFLLWQSVHSEFYFSDVFWPAFRRLDFLRAIRSFQQRTRRFGR